MTEPPLRLVWGTGDGDALERGMIGDEVNPFDSDGRLVWADKDAHVALLDHEGAPLAVAGLCSARARVAGRTVDVAGIGGVLVRADRRGGGLARRVVTAALERGAERGLEFALLFCWPSRAGLYARLGFAEVSDPVTVEQPGGVRTLMHMDTMWLPLTAGATWPAGDVALDGLPF